MLETTELINFIKRPLIKKASLIFLAMLLTSIVAIALQWSKLPPQVPLYYSLPWGESQLAAPWEITILPTLATSIFITNLALTFILSRDNELLSQIFILTGLFVTSMLLYSLLQILILVS